MFEAIVSFLFLGSMCLNVVAVIFLSLGLFAAMFDWPPAGNLLGVALYSAVVSAVLLVLGGLLTLASSVIGMF